MQRLHDDFDKMQAILQPLGADDWTGMMVTHAYMGPVPAFFFAAGQLMDYGVHTWDLREGRGVVHALNGDVADLLVPFMFALWQGTCRTDTVTEPFDIGIRVGGRNGGDYKVSVSGEGMSYGLGEIDDLPARDRVRRGQPRAADLQPDELRHRPRRPGAGGALPEPVLRHLVPHPSASYSSGVRSRESWCLATREVGVLRQCVDRLPESRDLERREPLAGPRAEVGEVEAAPGHGYDERLHLVLGQLGRDRRPPPPRGRRGAR